MATFGGKKKFTYEELIEIADILAEKVAERQPPPASGKSWLELGGRAQVNGSVTLGDVIVCFAIEGGFFCSGLFLGAVSVATGGSMEQAGYIVRDLTRIGVIFSLSRLVIDALDLYRIWGEVVERTTLAIVEWREGNRRPADEIIRIIPVHSADAARQDDEGQQFYALPNGQQVEWNQLTFFLRQAAENCDAWECKSWSREAWAEKSYDGYPNLGTLKARQWQGIKLMCEEAATTYPAFGAGIWRTNDLILIEQFIELLES